jgi:hypothetical protein
MLAAVGLGKSAQTVVHDQAPLELKGHEEAEKTKRRKPRSSHTRKRTSPNAFWPVVTWGNGKYDCPKPLSRKQLKRLCPEHVLLKKMVLGAKR